MLTSFTVSFANNGAVILLSLQSSVSVRVVNQLLTEMDGLEARKQVFIMGATNRPGELKSHVAPGYSLEFLEFLVGVCRPVPQILTLFQTKKCHFPHPFSDLAPEIHTRFQTFVVAFKLRISAEVKNSARMIYFGYFSFFTIHLELKRQIRLYAFRVPLKTIPDLRP